MKKKQVTYKEFCDSQFIRKLVSGRPTRYEESSPIWKICAGAVIESIEAPLALYPETQHLQIIDTTNECVAMCIVEQQALNVTDNDGFCNLQRVLSLAILSGS